MSRRPWGIQPRLVDQHFRVVLPRQVAETLGVKQGDHVAFTVDADGRAAAEGQHYPGVAS